MRQPPLPAAGGSAQDNRGGELHGLPVRAVRGDLPAARPCSSSGWPDRHLVDAAFNTWIWPLLGIIFLPFATLMYVILWQAGGLSGWDWFWVVLAALLDIAHGGASWTQRRQAPGYPQGVRG